MRRFLPLLALLHAASASAECADQVPDHGRCESATQVVWCESGEILSLDCDDGEVCAWNEPINAFDCIGGTCAADIDGDGEPDEVFPSGACTKPDGNVVWCEAGELMTLSCGTGTQCEYNDAIEAHDCVKISYGSDAAATLPEEEPGDGDGDVGAEPPPSSPEPDDQGPAIPVRNPRDEPGSGIVLHDEGPAGGCSAGAGSPSAPLLLLVALAGLWLGRLKRNDLVEPV